VAHFHYPLALNGLLASPRFAQWLEGDPLRVDALLRSPGGLPQMSILHLAHLSDNERAFFLTLLLDQVRAWLRKQEGTPDLRAILYIDELYGFMPPYPANPPTKAPLLTLLKLKIRLKLTNKGTDGVFFKRVIFIYLHISGHDSKLGINLVFLRVCIYRNILSRELVAVGSNRTNLNTDTTW
jgi:hypothetical protein